MLLPTLFELIGLPEPLIPGEGWQLVADGFQSTRGAACNANGEVFFADTLNNRIHRIDLDGKVSEFVAEASQANGVTVGADANVYSISEKSGWLMSYDTAGVGTLVLDGIRGHSLLAHGDVFRELQRGKVLEPFVFLDGCYLLLLDGTGYFSSQAIHCDGCLQKKNKQTGEVTYQHQLLGASIAHPDHREVIRLAPEPIAGRWPPRRRKTTRR